MPWIKFRGLYNIHDVDHPYYFPHMEFMRKLENQVDITKCLIFY